MTEVDEFLDDLDRLAATASTANARAFYRQLLPAGALALGADAASFSPPLGGDAAEGATWASAGVAAGPLLGEAAIRRCAAAGAPSVEASVGEGAPIVACPVEGATDIVGVLAFRLGATDTVSAQRSLSIVAALAESAGRFELRRGVEQLRLGERRLASIEEAILQLHAARGAKAVAREAVDGGCDLIGCDRLTVLKRFGRRWKPIAVSGVAQIRNRSDAVSAMTRLVSSCAGRALASQEESLRDDPMLAAEVDRYREATHASVLRVIPCEPIAGGEVVFTLLAEWFDQDEDPAAEGIQRALARHIAVAADRESRVTDRWLSAGMISAAVVLTMACLVIALTTIQTTLWIAADGRFERQQRSVIFAPLEGVVDELLISEAAVVEAGQPLVRLESPELRLKLEEVAEAIATTEAEITALETAQLRASLPGREAEANDPTALASRAQALREALAHQHRRRELLEEQRERLVVRSPLAGVIESWRPEETLAGRPIARGDRLLVVAAQRGWRLDLDLADHRAGRVLQAAEGGTPLAVEYVVRADPSQTHRAVVDTIAPMTHAAEDGQPVVRVVAIPVEDLGTNPRSGLGVSAKIDCGPRALGYVWLHEAIDAIRRRLF